MLGREREREALGRLLDDGRAGRGGVLVVHGEPGIGKTALLEFAVETGREFRVASICGVDMRSGCQRRWRDCRLGTVG